MTPQQLTEAAQLLREAARTGEYVAPLRERYPQLDAEGAYAIQRLNTEERIASGHRTAGCKIGLTARSVQAQLGVDRPDFGMLFDDMGYGDGEPVPLAVLQQPKIEAEVAFVFGRDLAAEQPSQVDVMNAIDYALPALEIVGSRIANWDIKFVDTVADNASSGAYVLGSTPRKLSEFDLRLCGMVMNRRGEPVSTGAGAACLGNPLNAVVWLARTMARLGSPLKAGDLVLSGALGPMVPVQPGDVFDTRINGLGNVKAVFEAEQVMSQLMEFAQLLDEAAKDAREVAQIDPEGKLSLPDAYAIQSASIQRRVDRGETRVGVKMGFTSRAKMVQMGIDDVIWGRLTSRMQVEEGTPVKFSRFVHPRVEPELAFVLNRPLAGNVTAVEALAAVEAIAPALEIIDSRYRDFKFSLPDVIADNASSSGFVIGAWSDPRQDFSNLGLTMSIDGRVAQVGSTAAILGHPLRSLVAAARLSAEAGEPLQAGWVVMAGGATPAEWIKPGQYVSIEMERLGIAGFHVSE